MVKPKKSTVLTTERLQRKLLAESSLEEFIHLNHPRRLLGSIHQEIIQWISNAEGKKYKLLLLPRDHMKSALAAYTIVWLLTRDPTIRVLLISSTSNLAVKQLKFIKDILTSDTYRLYWPDMVNKDEAKREKWTEREISLDHPARKEESIRDPSVFTAGLTSNIVGLHADWIVLDDVVVQANAYTKEGRDKVKEQYGYLSSVAATGAHILAVGTRYHPDDLYCKMQEMVLEMFDEYGKPMSKEPLFEVFGDGEPSKTWVESVGDGTGVFLWPRQQRSDGRWFGFNAEILAEKRAQYENRTHYRAQYYNDPVDTENSLIDGSLFQYYDPRFLTNSNGKWFFKGNRLNVVAAVDFAYSLGDRSDYSAVAVVGVDNDINYFVLEIDRFKSDKPSEYFKHILRMYEKWGFRKIRAEVTAGQKAIVKGLKESYIVPHGLSLSVEEHSPSRWQGSKEERILSILQPKYDNRQMWHYRGGMCQVLEEELIAKNPAHDDVKDALASAIDFAIAPRNFLTMAKQLTNTFQYHSRFGGVN